MFSYLMVTRWLSKTAVILTRLGKTSNTSGMPEHSRQTRLKVPFAKSSVPGWVASLLCAASRLKSDKARRKKTYKLIHHELFKHKVGCGKSHRNRPTYVYPQEVKGLIRTVFPKGVCDYPDPSHAEVVLLTVEDLSSLAV
ncbi:uncharacterized protein LOC125750413 isoform X2 [Brienomyrus brachyistius]|uniref:uncharacterized protein LOC125750413 isoform X2 n=1 Tax=Brienomyrus brachyistius TaxID=42636 RepID=UPI0020B1B058|nr:uncharacterized protein LOC125750413 isoform X2 [Brienomyrus brachyistius]